LITLCFTAVLLAEETEKSPPPANPQIDYPGFLGIVTEVQPIREKRRIPVEEFMKMAKEPNTVILDTRAKWAYDLIHVEGAIHLNFSDFSEEKLHKLIPDQDTRILIYCNNNFDFEARRGPSGTPSVVRDANEKVNEEIAQAVKVALAAEAAEIARATEIARKTGIYAPETQGVRLAPIGMTNKQPQLALNIPTFINLWGYGYKNIYELADLLPIADLRLPIEGTGVPAGSQPAKKHAE